MNKKISKKERQKKLEKKIKKAPIKEIPQKGNKKRFKIIMTALIIILILAIAGFAINFYNKEKKMKENFPQEFQQEDSHPMGERGDFNSLLEACDGLYEGDSCQADSISGTCKKSGEGNLVCIPEP